MIYSCFHIIIIHLILGVDNVNIALLLSFNVIVCNNNANNLVEFNEMKMTAQLKPHVSFYLYFERMVNVGTGKW